MLDQGKYVVGARNRVFVKFGLILLAGLAHCGAAESTEGASAGLEGSNVVGTERVCGKPGQTAAEAFSGCKRGDIIGLVMAGSGMAASVCDYSKTIMYSRGEPTSCVYTGPIRPNAKQ